MPASSGGKSLNKSAASSSFFPLWICLALGAATFIFFLPVRSFDFVRFDDPQYVLENEVVSKGLTTKGFISAFRENLAGNWHPITTLSHMLDCQLFGLNAGKQHLMNAFFHALNVMLLFFVFRKMTGAVWRSALVAALFAFHPLHVESVAWISERKDLLSAFFALLSLLFYADFVEQSKIRNPKSKISYGIALLFFTLGLLSKPMIVTLPFIFLLLDFWPLQRVQSSKFTKLIFEKIPFFALAAILSVITFLAQRSALAGEQMPLAWRLGNALVSYGRYVQKTFSPTQLTFLYPHPGKWPSEIVLGSALFLILISAAVLFFRRRFPYLLFGWLWFLGMLVPVIGLVQVGLQSMADRYTYLPLIGLFIMFVWGIGDIAKKYKVPAPALFAGSLALIFGCAASAQNQLKTWKESVSLYHRALEVSANDKIYRAAIQNPIYLEFHLRLCQDLADGGWTDKAESYLKEVAIVAPRNADVHLDLGTTLALQNKHDEAAKEYRIAAQLNPNNPLPHVHLGRIAGMNNRPDEAEEEFSKALSLQPNDAETHFMLGLLFEETRRRKQAIAEFREALRCKPDFADARQHLESLGGK